jgi:hypothetical protein
MTDQTPDYSPLSEEQLETLSDSQKQIFLRLDKSDRQFFGKNFTPRALGKALERKWEIVQSQARLVEIDKSVRERLMAEASQAPEKPLIRAEDVAMGAAGVAGVVGIGVLAKKIAPDGKASWRGVKPRDLVEPLVSTFARQEKTDIRFEAPTSEGILQANVLLRTSSGMLPGLSIVLAPLSDTTQVQISKVSSQSVMEAVKEGGQKIFDLVQDGLHMGRRPASAEGFFDLAGKVVSQGVDIAKIVKDLDLEDKAWGAIQKVADPIQAIYDELMAGERETRLKLEMAWDDYKSCPKCRVEFGAEDVECRVCGAARPLKPEQADPRGV